MPPIRLIILAVSFSCISTVSLALPGDLEQSIELEADEAKILSQTGESVYIGHVNLVQGSLRISADRLVVKSVEQKPSYLEMTGTPVHFFQKINDQGLVVNGTADKVRYDSKKGKAVLEGNAQVSYGDNSFSSDIIVYEPATGRIVAGESDRPGSRVKAKLQPGLLTDLKPSPSAESPAAEVK